MSDQMSDLKTHDTIFNAIVNAIVEEVKTVSKTELN
jgi:hypothetical protein